MAIHEKHASVLQYKETYCEPHSTFNDICYGITGDAPLYSMFRKHPEGKAAPVPCPFKSAPFAFSYNRGAGDCSNPPSKAESCTDDSRLVLKYQACPDIPSTESNVEELVCLATWKEGSTKYLIGKIISQGNRRAMLTDEEQYRCFIYQKATEKSKTVYHIAQSGDATCTGLSNVFEGSRTMKFTVMDNHHNRCKFPSWITIHHTWLSLDHRKTYKFSQRNATLKILDEEPKPNRVVQPVQPVQQFGFQEFGFESQDQRNPNTEMRVICHSILQSQEEKKVQIVAHITAGCDSGYVCMVFYKRDSNVIEIQESETYEDNPDDACRHFDPAEIPYTTLITTSLHPKKCPNLGRYVVNNQPPVVTERRKRRQQQNTGHDIPLNNGPGAGVVSPECISPTYDSLAVGCGGSTETMEFRTGCIQQPIKGYTCHGAWQDNDMVYVITSPTSRKSTDTLRHCFVYSIVPSSTAPVGEGGKPPPPGGPMILRLSAVADSCHRHIRPGIDGIWAYNFTSNGTCAELEGYNAALVMVVPSLLLLASLFFVFISR